MDIMDSKEHPNEDAGTRKAPRKDTRPQWTVKGVAPETRAAVTEAARKADMPIGKWIDRALLKAATEDPQREPQSVSLSYGEDILKAIDGLSKRLERLEQRRSLADLAVEFGRWCEPHLKRWKQNLAQRIRKMRAEERE